MTKDDFFHSTPKDIRLFIEAHYKNIRDEMQRIEYHAWAAGVFVQAAVGSCLSKKVHYPECPVSESKKTIKEIAEENGKTEEELQQEMRMIELCVKQANANIAQARIDRGKRNGSERE